jgi:ribosome-binding factor A
MREELAKLIERELEFPNALVTITEVDVNKKLDYADVKVSVIPSQFAPEALEKLVRAQGHLQHLLLTKINIKPMPRIAFSLDRGPENAAQVEKALLKK